MIVVVTGATGFLGAHLVPRLRARGHLVRTIARSAIPDEWTRGESPVHHTTADLADKAAVGRALDGAEAVYHLAGLVSFHHAQAREMYALHVDRTRELLDEVRARKIGRFILASTSGTIAVSRDERVCTEDETYPIPIVGRWPYYMSKIIQERMVIDFCGRHAIPLVVLNPSLLLGPGDTRMSSTWAVAKFLARDFPALPGGGISIADVRDVASAAVAALTKGDGRYLMGLNLTMREFFGRLERLTGVAAPRIRMPRDVTMLAGKFWEKLATWRKQRPSVDAQEVEIGEHWFWLDSSRAKRDLGFAARDPHETLFDTVQYLQKHIAGPRAAREVG